MRYTASTKWSLYLHCREYSFAKRSPQPYFQSVFKENNYVLDLDYLTLLSRASASQRYTVSREFYITASKCLHWKFLCENYGARICWHISRYLIFELSNFFWITESSRDSQFFFIYQLSCTLTNPRYCVQLRWVSHSRKIANRLILQTYEERRKIEESTAGRREILLSDPSLYLHPARPMRLTSWNGQEMKRMHRSNSDDGAAETEKRRWTKGCRRRGSERVKIEPTETSVRDWIPPWNGGSSLPEAFDRKSRSEGFPPSYFACPRRVSVIQFTLFFSLLS